MLAYQLAVLVLLLAVLAHAAWNLRQLPRLVPRRPAGHPLVSVLVPARNEEANIGPCLDGWLSQDYGPLEVVMLDDDSRDATAALAAARARRHGRLRLLAGEPLPPGWTGKNHACAQLARAARGDILLFADADVTPGRGVVEATVGLMEALGADALTALPRHCGGTWLVRQFSRLQTWVVLCFLPVGLVLERREPWLAAGNGQFFAFRREAYLASGGHAAVRESLAEDAALARRLKAAGKRLAVADGSGCLTCFPFGTTRELWASNAKNLHPVLFGSRALTLALAAALAALYLGPYAVAAAGLVARREPLVWVGLSAAQMACADLSHILAARRFGHPARSAPLHPVPVALLIALLLDSARRYARGEPLAWKERLYAPEAGLTAGPPPSRAPRIGAVPPR